MQIKLTNVRLSFPVLFTPEEFSQGDGKFRYSAAFLIERGSANDKAVEAAIVSEAKDKLGPKWEALLNSYRGSSGKFCYTDGDLKDYDGYAGHTVLASHRRAADGAPKVLDRDRTKLTEGDGVVYAGCYVNAIVDIYVQKAPNPGVRCGLGGVQFCADGDAFTAGQVSEDAFDDLGTGADASALL